jgi:hypothetical protein
MGEAMKEVHRLTTLTLKVLALMTLVGSLTMVPPAPTFAVITQALKDACHDDYLAYCDGMTVPSPQLRSCLRAHMMLLSKRCLHALVNNGEVSKADIAAYHAAKKGR